MSVAIADKPWVKRALAVILVLAVLAPVFGWAAGAVGYAEPIDVAAETTGADDDAAGGHGLFPDYTVPGLGTGAGTLISALVGIGLTLAVAVLVGRALEE